ncbi:hypothetical protein FACS1894151_10410 [Spirochaetia bacterium]|nr:hypothetical protein FACS1894151_10410 [Spirochaetia bacterium]
MGLLNKAAKGSDDPMGKSLRERICALAPKKTSAYTALSLLKSYCAYDAGVCLSLQDGVYSSYASVGLGIGKMNLPKELIAFSGNGLTKALSPQDIALKSIKDDSIIWIYPLDGAESLALST